MGISWEVLTWGLSRSYFLSFLLVAIRQRLRVDSSEVASLTCLPAWVVWGFLPAHDFTTW